MVTRLIGLCMIAPLVSGCALFTKPADTVEFQRGAFFVAYFDMGTVYTTMKVKIEARCKAGTLDKDFCAYAAKASDEFERNVHRKIMKALANPTTSIDWEAVGEAAKFIAGLAGAAL